MRLVLLLLAVCCRLPIAADEQPNPWLRPHFTIAIRSRDSFRVVEREPPESQLRQAVWGSPFANLVSAVHPELPDGISVTRTYLRCKPLGWMYGGHTLDVMSMDALEYESLLRQDGRTVFPVQKGNSLLRTDRNAFLLPGNGCVATLRVPGGFEGTAGDISKALQRAIAARASTPDAADWTVRVKPSELVDPPLWRGLQAGIAVAIQPHDDAPDRDAFAKTELGRAFVEIVMLLVRDAESCELAATLNDENRSGIVRLTIAAKPDSRLHAEMSELSRFTAHDLLPQRFMNPSTICGVIRIPPDSVFASVASRLKSKPQSTDVGFTEGSATHAVFGTVANDLRNTRAFVAFCDLSSTGRIQSDQDFGSALWLQFQPPRHLTVLGPHSELISAESANVVSSIRSANDALSNAPDADRRPCWMVAHARISQCLPLFYPKLALPENAQDEDADTIRIVGHAERDRIRIELHFPPKSDQFIYVLFETVVDGLQSLGKSLPFDEVPPAGSH